MDKETKLTIETYNSQAEEYSKRWHNFHIPKIEPTFKKFLNLLNGDRILDIGCGTGRDCNYYSSKGYKVIGIDLSEGMLNQAKKNVPNVHFLQMDIRKLEFPDNSFDGIHCWAVIQHVKRQELPAILKEFSRVTTQYGAALITAREGDFEGYREEMYSSPRWFTYYEKAELTDLLAEAGFRVIEIEDDYKYEKRKVIKMNHYLCKKR